MTTHVPQDIEAQRLALQATLDGRKSQEERNRLGQFATPTSLARDILAYGLALLPDGAPVRFFDPAIGTGSFYSALLATAPAERIETAEGFEVDEHYEAPARALWAETPLRMQRADFTMARPPADERERSNLLICNPPYVRHHHLVNDEKVRLQEITKAAFGMRIDGLAGLYCYFLALAHFWMRAGAVAGWLIPSEFMNVNYGRAVKHYLLNNVTLLHIHRFDPNDVQFADALVSSAVVFLRNAPPPEGHMVEFSYGGTLSAPVLSKRVAADELRREPKWTRFPVAEIREAAIGTTLNDFFRIKRGLATGDNRFFILTPAQIEARGLPWECFRPILPSPRYLQESEVPADERGHPILERKLFLLDCRLPEEEIKGRYPALWRYLQSGKPSVSERYLCRSRRPWYRQEERPPTPFICTYIGRSDTRRGKPFRFILNHSQATAANVYLLLYPKPVLARALAADPALVRRVWELLNAIQPGELLDEGRVYGGGLHKLEPNELANVRADGIQALLSVEVPRPPIQHTLFDAVG
jgi:adenine-specific DNA-methyltransferase